jgi:ferrous iron transport protein A
MLPLYNIYNQTMKRLSELEAGQKAIINSFEKDEIFIKLMEMGCIPGEVVQVEQVAPLGDPISISERSQKYFCRRRNLI